MEGECAVECAREPARELCPGDGAWNVCVSDAVIRMHRRVVNGGFLLGMPEGRRAQRQTAPCVHAAALISVC